REAARMAALRPPEKFKCVDRYLESTEIVRRIKKVVLDGGKASDILVVARNIKSYAAPLASAFKEAGLSCFIDEAIALHSLPVVQLILRLIELSANNFQRQDVISCLRSAYFNLSRLQGSEKESARVARLSLEHLVVAGLPQWQQMLSACGDKLPPEFIAQVNTFFNAVAPLPSATLRQHVAWAEDLLDQYLSLSHDTAEDPFRSWEEHKAVLEFRRSLASLVHEEAITGSALCSAEYFLSRVRVMIERANFRRVPEAQDYVTVCGADLAPNKSFEHVFVLGMVESEFPRRSKQTAFLSSDEVDRWLLFGVDIRNPRFHPSFESALFTSLLQRARTSAVLSCPTFE
ncbi:MAG: hypothetical protein ACRD3W_13150, partial [Terriglobales bacterium]